MLRLLYPVLDQPVNPLIHYLRARYMPRTN